MATARRTARTPKKAADWGPKFLAALARTGVVQAAARLAKVGRRTVYDRRGTDPEFAAAWDEAVELSTAALETEAYRRAVTGTLRPVFHQGVKSGTVREHSDTLLIFLLKARRPAVYRDSHRVEVAGDPANPIKVGPADVFAKIASYAADLEAAAAAENDRPAEGGAAPGDGGG